MGLYKRGKTYWIAMRANGRRIQMSTGTSNKKLAEDIHANIRMQVIEGKYFEQEKAKRITFKEMSEAYMRKYRKVRDETSLKRLMPYFGGKFLSDITPANVENYILERADAGAKPSTIYNEYGLGRRMFNVARKNWKWVRENPFADVQFSELQKIENERDAWLTVEDEERLLANATPDYLKDVITFAIHTGCRRGEILAMTWGGNIDLKRRTVSIKASKGGRLKTIPMSDRLYQLMLRMSKVRHISGKVFPVSVTALKDAFERAVKKAGLDGFRFHDLRHTFATRLMQAGVDILAIQKMMGHSTLKMTARYAHHHPDSLRKSVRALDDCYNFATFGAERNAPMVEAWTENEVKSIASSIGSV